MEYLELFETSDVTSRLMLTFTHQTIELLPQQVFQSSDHLREINLLGTSKINRINITGN